MHPVNHAVYESNPAPIHEMQLKQWENTLSSNTTGTFLIIRAFMRQINKLSEQEKGKVAIVLIGSTAGKYGEAGRGKISQIRLGH